MTKENRMSQLKFFLMEVLSEEETDYIIQKLDELHFFEAPASTKYHGAYEGGLYDHSFMVAKTLVSLTKRLDLKWHHDSSPYLVGIFHDLCKCNVYEKRDDGTWGYRNNIPLCGHGDKSVILVMSKIWLLNEEEILCIRWHMGSFEKDTSLWNNYGAAVEKYQNVLWTHAADMYASKVMGV